MKLKLFSTVFFVLFCIMVLHSCTEESIDVKPHPVTLDLTTPATLSEVANLGRILFYDTKLSVNNAISCASCHKQAFAFGDNSSFSRGFENSLTLRNSIAIQNISFTTGQFGTTLFWDGREADLATMVLQPIVNHVEMGMPDVDGVVERVRNSPYYGQLFKDIWGQNEISADMIAQALGNFIISINTQQGHTLSALELEGQNLFLNKYNCNGCHNQFGAFGMGYETVEFVNIGLDEISQDPGRQQVTGNPEDGGKFRIPHLSNVALTAPYMHDGRFGTLEEVLDHYSHGIKANVNLDPKLRDIDGQPLELNISENEKTALIAFLNSFTDYSMITNPDFSSPFK